MALRSSSTAKSTSTSQPSVAVPTGAAVNDIVIAQVVTDNQANIPFTWPTGFTELAHEALTLDGGSVAWAWKRLTAADTGSYTMGGVTTKDWQMSAYCFSGRDTTNPPVASTVAFSNASNASPVTATANGVTALAGDDLFWGCGTDNTLGTITSPSFTTPTGYTKDQDQWETFAWGCGCHEANVAAGATGSVAGTFSWSGGGSAGWAALLVRLPAAGGSTNGSASGSLPTVTLSSPAGSAAGDGGAAGSLNMATLSTPSGSAVGDGDGNGALSVVSTSAPSGSATGDASCSGALSTVTLSAPSGSAGVDAFASGVLNTALMGAPAVFATGDASASGALVTCSMAAPVGSATGTGQNGNAFGALPTLGGGTSPASSPRAYTPTKFGFYL